MSPRILASSSGIVPPQDGLQPVESASAKASVKTFWPVAFATVISDGVLIVMSMYGAARPLPGPGGVLVVVVVVLVVVRVVVVVVGAVPPVQGAPFSLQLAGFAVPPTLKPN